MKNNDEIQITDSQKYHGTERTEQVQEIIERIPTKFGYRITAVVAFVFFNMLLFGWIIRYPDVVTGQVVINTPVAPIRLVAAAPGKIRLLNTTSQSVVKAGDVIAYIESATSFDTLQMIKELLKNYNPSDPYNTNILKLLPKKVALGELTSRYYNFVSSLHQMTNFYTDKLYDKQIYSLHNLHNYQLNEVEKSQERIDINKSNLAFSEKFLKRDSTLFADRVSAEAELDRTKMAYLNSQAGFSSAVSNEISAKKEAQQTISKISEVNVQKSEKQKELEVSLLAAYNDLIDNITIWEQRYLFKAPFAGKVQFLKFWTNDQFVQAQEPVFSVVPNDNKPIGQVSLPAIGGGKVKVGQEAIIKLDDFPYNEYGSVTGTVNSISLTTKTEKTSQGDIETFLITVDFPKGLVTNYGRPIEFRHESKGVVEIITKDRRLIERLFDNLKYVLNK